LRFQAFDRIDVKLDPRGVASLEIARRVRGNQDRKRSAVAMAHNRACGGEIVRRHYHQRGLAAERMEDRARDPSMVAVNDDDRVRLSTGAHPEHVAEREARHRDDHDRRHHQHERRRAIPGQQPEFVLEDQ
jgi:hypothetical protein